MITANFKKKVQLEGVRSALVYDARLDPFKYSHHPQITFCNGKFFAMWSNSLKDEDSSSQLVRWAESDDGCKWKMKGIFAEDPDGPELPLRRFAAGWRVDEQELTGYFCTFSGVSYNNEVKGQKWSDDLKAEARVVRNGVPEEKIGSIHADFIANESPRRTGPGRWIIPGEDKRGITQLLVNDTLDSVSGWRKITLPQSQDKHIMTEPSWFENDKGVITMFFRDDTGSGFLYACESADNGDTWGSVERTGFPDNIAKFACGRLEDGRFFIIGNSHNEKKWFRIPLTISVSDDGARFYRQYFIRAEETNMRFEGMHKGPGYQYPGVLVKDNRIFIVYSINKEDVGISVFDADRME